MCKRGLAFLLAAVLAFAPVLQVNAAEFSAMNMQQTEEVQVEEETAKLTERSEASVIMEEADSIVPKVSEVPEVTPGIVPEVSATPEAGVFPEGSASPEASEAPEASAFPEGSASPEASETPETSAFPEGSASPEASEAPEASAFPEGSASPEASEAPEASASPEGSASPEVSETPEASASPEESASPEVSETLEAELNINTELVTLLTEDFDLTASTTDASGEGWTWKASTKTFTMNGYHSTGKVSLPANATVNLAKGSANTIDTSETARYGIYGQGDLTITGSGKLTIEYFKNEAVYTEGVITFLDTNVHFINTKGLFPKAFPYKVDGVKIIASNIKNETKDSNNFSQSYLSYEGCTLTAGEIKSNCYYSTYNRETELYELIFKKNPVYITKHPEKVSKAYVGEPVQLQAAGKALSGDTVKYQWYSTTDYKNPGNGAVKIKDATSKKLTVTGKSRGIKYYFCAVTCAGESVITDVAAVVTSNEGMKICTETPSFSTGTSIDKLDTEGWKYDQPTHTVTFENIDLQVPFPTNYTNVQIRSGWTVVFEGTNYLEDNDGHFTLTNAKQIGKVTTFTGTGSVKVNHISTGYLDDDAEVWYTGGLTMYITEFDNDTGKIILDNVTVKSENESLMYYNDLTLQNGAYLEVASSLRVWADIVVGVGCTLVTGERIECAGNLTIEEDATVIIGRCLDMGTVGTSVNKARILSIAGTLYIKESTSQPIYLYSEAESPLVQSEGVGVIYPEGAVWDNKVKSYSTYYYGYKYNDSYNLGGLTLGKWAVETKEITGSKRITGIAKYGNVLKAGAVTPADAAVAYQWQYAYNVNGPWNDISNEKAKTYTVSTKYAGYYLRVVTKGMGDYTGKILSDPVGPVAGDPGTLTGIWCTGGTGGEIRVGTLPFDGSKTSYSTSSDMTAEGTVSYVTDPINENAKVTIRNKTTGFEQVGKTAEVPMQFGDNEIEIEVSYGLKNYVYSIEHEIKDREYSLDLSVSRAYTAISLTATWTDENGQIQSMTADSDDSCYKSIKAGTEVTITSTNLVGTYPYQYDGLDAVPDQKKEGFPVTFAITEDTDVYFSTNYAMAYPPEGLSAKWQVAEDSAQVKVKALQIPDAATTEYVETYVWITDSDGKVVDEYTFDGEVNMPEKDGYYRVEFFGLDCTRKYNIYARYEAIYNEDKSEKEQIASFTLEKRKPVTLSTKSEHVVLKPGETVDVPILYEGYAGSEVTLETSYDAEVVSVSGTQAKTDADGNRILQIKAAGEGTTYLTLRGEDYENAEGMQYVFTSVRVDVSSADEALSLNLGMKKGTLNLYDDSALAIPVYQMECGHDIEGAQFVDETLNDKLVIEVVDDRTLKIIPKVPEDDGVIDYAKWVKEEGVTGTFTSKIKVNYNGAASRESEESLKITLKAVAPEVKVSALSFNSFYKVQNKDLKISLKGQKVQRLQIDTAKTSDAVVACPVWLFVNEADKSVIFDGEAIPGDKVSSTLYLKIWPEGYRLPVQTKVKVKVSYTTPKLKFKKSTVTIAKDMEYSPYLEMQLISADKKVKYKTIGVKSISSMSYTEYMQMSKKMRKKYVSPHLFDDSEFEKETGKLTLKYGDIPTNGKVVLYANIENGKKPVKVTFNLKTQASPTIKLNKKFITMDAIFGSYPLEDLQFVKVSCSASEYQINQDNISFKVIMAGDKTNTNYSSNFGMWWDEEKQAIRIQRYHDAIPGKTYKVTVSVKGIEKSASFNIKVKYSAIPAFKASKETITLNRMKMDVTKAVGITLPKKYGTGYYVGQIEVIKPDNTADNGTLGYMREYNQDGAISVCFNTTDSTVKGTYTVKIHGGLYGGTMIEPVVIKVKITDKFPGMGTKPAAVTLNKDLAGCDKAAIALPVTTDYRYASDTPWSLVSVEDANGKDASDKLECDLKDNTVTVKCNDRTAYGAVYKLKLVCEFGYGVKKHTTVTVKAAKKAAAISIKGKAKGSIDTTRPGITKATISYTYTNWNEACYEIADKPVLAWEVYAKKNKKAVKMADGAMMDNGLVAKGSSESALAVSGSWFANAGYAENTPYKVAFMIDTDSAAWKAGDISPDYTYTVKATLKFPSANKEIKAKALTFKVKQGKTKFLQSPKNVLLSKLDPKGRALLTITDKDKDRLKVEEITRVEVAASRKVPVSKAIEIVPVYSANESTTYAVCWKDKTVSNVKSGSVKLHIYLEGNDPARKKPNATLQVKVNVK